MTRGNAGYGGNGSNRQAEESNDHGHGSPKRNSYARGSLAATFAAASPRSEALAQSTSGASLMPYEAKPLPIDPKSIKGMSDKIITSHHENNYGGAVRRLNAIDGELAKIDVTKAPVFVINGLKREQLVAANSMILHELFFASLGAGGDPGGDLAEALKRDFGSTAAWANEFAFMGKALGGGSGWVLLTYSARMGRFVNQWAADHTMSLAGATPILALDMYEHAYHMDFGAKAAAYVDTFMAAIDWSATARRHKEAIG
jgi:Fe-Mn family superoxide dismutase